MRDYLLSKYGKYAPEKDIVQLMAFMDFGDSLDSEYAGEEFSKWDEEKKRSEFLKLYDMWKKSRINELELGLELAFKNGQLPEYIRLRKGIDEKDIEIMNHICDGIPIKNIRSLVNLSESTVKARCQRLISLTECENTKGAINKFIEYGIISHQPLPVKTNRKKVY